VSSSHTTIHHPVTPRKVRSPRDPRSPGLSWSHIKERASALKNRISIHNISAKKTNDVREGQADTPTRSAARDSPAPQLRDFRFDRASLEATRRQARRGDYSPVKAEEGQDDLDDVDEGEEDFDQADYEYNVPDEAFAEINANRSDHTHSDVGDGELDMSRPEHESWVTESVYNEGAGYAPSSVGGNRESVAWGRREQHTDYSQDVSDYSTVGLPSYYARGDGGLVDESARLIPGPQNEGSTLSYVYQHYEDGTGRENSDRSLPPAGSSQQANCFGQFNFNFEGEGNRDSSFHDLPAMPADEETPAPLQVNRTRQAPGRAPDMPLPQRPASHDVAAKTIGDYLFSDHSPPRSYGDTRQLLQMGMPSDSRFAVGAVNRRLPTIATTDEHVNLQPRSSQMESDDVFSEEEARQPSGETAHQVSGLSPFHRNTHGDAPSALYTSGIPSVWLRKSSPMQHSARAAQPSIEEPPNSARLSRQSEAEGIPSGPPAGDSWITVDESNSNQLANPSSMASYSGLGSSVHSTSRIHPPGGRHRTRKLRLEHAPGDNEGVYVPVYEGGPGSRMMNYNGRTEPAPATQTSSPFTFSPHALYRHPALVDLNLLSSEPNEDVLSDQSARRSRAEDDQAEQQCLLPSSPAAVQGISFTKMTEHGPRGNLTGTPQGTDMRDAGSSLVTSSSPPALTATAPRGKTHTYQTSSVYSHSTSDLLAGHMRSSHPSILAQHSSPLRPPQPVYSPRCTLRSGGHGRSPSQPFSNFQRHYRSPVHRQETLDLIEVEEFRPGQRLYHHPPLHGAASRTTIKTHSSHPSDMHNIEQYESIHSHTPLTQQNFHYSPSAAHSHETSRPGGRQRTFSGSSPRELELARLHHHKDILHTYELQREQARKSWYFFGLAFIIGPIGLPIFGLGALDSTMAVLTNGRIPEVGKTQKRLWMPACFVWFAVLALVVVVVGFKTGAFHAG
jgi:hypothetical protein